MSRAVVRVDGAMGEGGGQVLRSALTLAVLTGRAVQITNIRAGRSKPGLRPQHVTSAKAAREICGGQLSGVFVGSERLDFTPGPVQPGRYRFRIQTAGATSLVLQTLFLPLSLAGKPSEVEISGGTHVPWSPCFDYLHLNWLPALGQIGYRAELQMSQAGYNPRGGGSIQARIQPAAAREPIQMVERGALREIRVISGVSQLPRSIAERQHDRALHALKDAGPVTGEILEIPANGPGTFLIIQAEYKEGRACFFGLGRKGKPAERVADEAVHQWNRFQATTGAVDRFLADQLLLPLALTGGISTLQTEQVTGHLTTNAALIRKFLPADITIEGGKGQAGLVTIQPLSKA